MVGKRGFLNDGFLKVLHFIVAILVYRGALGQPDDGQNVNKDRCLCLEKIADKLRLPVSLVNANDGSNRIFIAEQYGAVNVFYPNGTKLDEPLIDISSRIGKLPTVSEEGVGDITFHPDFASNGLFYMLFSTPDKKKGIDHHSNLGEFKISAKDVNKADPDYFRLLLKFPEPGWAHNAEKLLFGIDNYLYVFTGDGGSKANAPSNGAQKMNKYNGKVLRIDVGPHTGDDPFWIPDDNPFQEPLADGTYPLPEIYAVGLRNPWRCAVDSGDRLTGHGRGRMFCGDVGQHSVEEINQIIKGGNYGWNIIEGAEPQCENCKIAPIGDKSMVEPIFSYDHKTTQLGRAVIGGEFYRGCLYPQLNGLYIWGDHYAGLLHRLYENSTGGWEHSEIELCDTSVCKAPLTDDFASKIISFGQDENGEVYMLAVNNANPAKKAGYVYRFVDPEVQKDPGICEAEFQERVASMKRSKLKHKSSDSLFEAFPGMRQEASTPKLALPEEEDLTSKKSTPGTKSPPSPIDNPSLTTDGKLSNLQTIPNRSPADLSKIEQYLNYIKQLQKITKQSGNLREVQEEANEQTDSGAIRKDTDESTGANFEELIEKMIQDPLLSNILENFLDLPQNNESTINNKEQLSDDTIDRLINEILNDPNVMEGPISDLIEMLNIDDQSGIIDTTTSENNDDTEPNESNDDTEPSKKENTQDKNGGPDSMLQLIDELFGIGPDIAGNNGNIEEVEQPTPVNEFAHNQNENGDVNNADDEGDATKEPLSYLFENPNVETLAKLLYRRPIIKSMLADLTDATEAGRKLQAFLLEGPNAAKSIALLIQSPDADKPIRDILAVPGAVESIKEQLVLLKEASDTEDLQQGDTLKEEIEAKKDADSAEDDIKVFTSLLLDVSNPVERILHILSIDDTANLVAELLVFPQSEKIVKGLLEFPFGEDFINVLLDAMTLEEWIINLDDNSLLESLLEYLLQIDSFHELVESILSDVFREGISQLVNPSEQIPTENSEHQNGDEDIADIVSLIEHNANYVQLVDAILKKSNVAQVMVDLLNDENVGDKMLTFLESKYPRIRIGSYLLMGSNAMKSMDYILQSPEGTKLFIHLLKSAYMGTNTASLIKAMYTDMIVAKIPAEDTPYVSQNDVLTALKKITGLINCQRAKDLITDLTLIHESAEQSQKANAMKQEVSEQAQEALSTTNDEPTPIVPGTESVGTRPSNSFKMPRTFEHVFQWHRARAKAHLFSK